MSDSLVPIAAFIFTTGWDPPQNTFFKLVLTLSIYFTQLDTVIKLVLIFIHIVALGTLKGNYGNYINAGLLILISVINIAYIVLIVSIVHGLLLYIVYSLWCGAQLMWSIQVILALPDHTDEHILPISKPPKIMRVLPSSFGVGKSSKAIK